MNGIELLKNDHKRILDIINELIDEFTGKAKHTNEESVRERPRIFGKLRETLIQHLDIEERTFFPKLKAFVDTGILVDECYREHKRIDETLKRIEKLPEETQLDCGDDLLAELERRVQIFVVREEDWLFPKAKLVLGDAKLEEIFLKMESRRSNRAEMNSPTSPGDRF